MTMRIGAAAILLLTLAAPVCALEFVATRQPAILYDAPSASATKIAVLSAGYPLEKLVAAAGWVKVRDETGKLAWIEESALGGKRAVLVTAPAAQVTESPREDAPVRFRAARSVSLELLPGQDGGWIKVQHANGQQGYVRIRDVWGM